MTDRECIVEYECGHPSEEERESSKVAVSVKTSSLLLDHDQLLQYQRARNSEKVAVRLTMAFGQFILSDGDYMVQMCINSFLLISQNGWSL